MAARLYLSHHEGLPSLVDEFCVTHTISLDACAAHAVMGPRAIALLPTCPIPPAMRPRA